MEVANRNYIEILGKEEEIPEIAETYAYDVVVVGAGTPGIPCALRAQEKGLSVAVIQKESAASACGNIGAGIVTDESKPEDVARLVSIMQNHSGHRPKREVLEVWAKYSGDAVSSMIHWGEEAGCQVQNVGTGPHKPMLENTTSTSALSPPYSAPNRIAWGAPSKSSPPTARKGHRLLL